VFTNLVLKANVISCKLCTWLKNIFYLLSYSRLTDTYTNGYFKTQISVLKFKIILQENFNSWFLNTEYALDYIVTKKWET
jgi:hypothetical protein